ncbi:MAG TPA: ribbon-helix-helix domain-containing protein [Myxococcaceae bacterium]|nr:ribbon-helix-helix domain-containing protein [Myxococcaceae bacterium]
MASRRTTIVLTDEDRRALKEASKREGLSQSELIRKGIRSVTAAYRRRRRVRTGWLRLTRAEKAEVLAEQFGDRDG